MRLKNVEQMAMKTQCVHRFVGWSFLFLLICFQEVQCNAEWPINKFHLAIKVHIIYSIQKCVFLSPLDQCQSIKFTVNSNFAQYDLFTTQLSLSRTAEPFHEQKKTFNALISYIRICANGLLRWAENKSREKNSVKLISVVESIVEWALLITGCSWPIYSISFICNLYALHLIGERKSHPPYFHHAYYLNIPYLNVNTNVAQCCGMTIFGVFHLSVVSLRLCANNVFIS